MFPLSWFSSALKALCLIGHLVAFSPLLFLYNKKNYISLNSIIDDRLKLL